MTTKLTKKVKEEALAEWRQKHFKEMNKNIKVMKAIRDNPDATDKNRIEATKAIARMLGTLSPEKVTQATAKATAQQAQKMDFQLPSEEEERIDKILNE